MTKETVARLHRHDKRAGLGHARSMTARTRKLIGTVALLIFLMLYAWIAAAIGSGRITEAHWILQLAYFLVAGLLWVLPAAILIRWMQQPD